MPTLHEFTLVLDATDIEDLPLAEVHEACHDASVESSSGVAYLVFDRAAANRDDAIATASRDLTAVLIANHSPFRVVRVEAADYDPCRYDAEPAGRSDVA